MKHKVKVTVLDKIISRITAEILVQIRIRGVCPCYNVGDEFVFYRDGDRDDFGISD